MNTQVWAHRTLRGPRCSSVTTPIGASGQSLVESAWIRCWSMSPQEKSHETAGVHVKSQGTAQKSLFSFLVLRQCLSLAQSWTSLAGQATWLVGPRIRLVLPPQCHHSAGFFKRWILGIQTLAYRKHVPDQTSLQGHYMPRHIPSPSLGTPWTIGVYTGPLLISSDWPEKATVIHCFSVFYP